MFCEPRCQDFDNINMILNLNNLSGSENESHELFQAFQNIMREFANNIQNKESHWLQVSATKLLGS